MPDIARLIVFATIGNRRQIGRIGLDEQSIERHAPRHFLDDLRILESDDTRQRNVETEFQRCFRHFPGFRKAVKDAADLPCPLLAHHP